MAPGNINFACFDKVPALRNVAVAFSAGGLGVEPFTWLSDAGSRVTAHQDYRAG
jgi:hypothetical protein